MIVLIIGASSKNSIGFHIGEALQKSGEHTIAYASRSGHIGFSCDVTNRTQVQRLIEKVRPDAVLLCAGVFVPPMKLGRTRAWDKITEHLKAKSVGALMLADALLAHPKSSERYFIALGGRDLSNEPGFGAYTIGNGALWSAIRFLNRHTAVRSFYVDMPFVEDSAMEQKYRSETKGRLEYATISSTQVVKTIENILNGRTQKSRILLGRRDAA